MNDRGCRDVYLPAGRWVDFWSGEVREGPVWTGERNWPLARLPLWVRAGAVVPFHLAPVNCTDDMRPGAVEDVCFDEHYRGFAGSALSRLGRFDPA
jgi:alpha-D-xyloside xylohydrolase